jgi:hypothetical protein
MGSFLPCARELPRTGTALDHATTVGKEFNVELRYKRPDGAYEVVASGKWKPTN